MHTNSWRVLGAVYVCFEWSWRCWTFTWRRRETRTISTLDMTTTIHYLMWAHYAITWKDKIYIKFSLTWGWRWVYTGSSCYLTEIVSPLGAKVLFRQGNSCNWWKYQTVLNFKMYWTSSSSTQSIEMHTANACSSWSVANAASGFSTQGVVTYLPPVETFTNWVWSFN